MRQLEIKESRQGCFDAEFVHSTTRKVDTIADISNIVIFGQANKIVYKSNFNFKVTLTRNLLREGH